MSSTRGNRTPQIVAASVAPFVLSVIAVGARFLARRVGGMKLWWDDWLALLALVSFTLAVTADLTGAHSGSGKHLQTVLEEHPQTLPTFLKAIYAGEVFYPVTIGCIKCSVLSLYIRLFGIHRIVSRVCYVLIGLTVAWGTSTLLTTLFQCHPVSSAWDPLSTRSNCISLRPFLIGTNIPNILLDCSALVTPWYPIWKLQLPLAKKIMIGGILLLGAFETAFSIIRLVFITRLENSDLTWNYTPAIIWSSVESSVGIICVCLPVVASLITRVTRGRPNSKKVTKASRPEYAGREAGYSKRKFDRLGDDTKDLVSGSDVSPGITRTTEFSVHKEDRDIELHKI